MVVTEVDGMANILWTSGGRGGGSLGGSEKITDRVIVGDSRCVFFLSSPGLQNT